MWVHLPAGLPAALLGADKAASWGLPPALASRETLRPSLHVLVFISTVTLLLQTIMTLIQSRYMQF